MGVPAREAARVPALKDTWIRTPIDSFLLEAIRAKAYSLRQESREKRNPACDPRRHRPSSDSRKSPHSLPTSGPMHTSGGGSSAGFAALRRALGASLAGCGPLRRHERVRTGRASHQAWRYRDYVIRSLQRRQTVRSVPSRADRGRRNLAGPERSAGRLGFHRAGSEHLVGGNQDQEMNRQEVLVEMTAGIGNVFLGLTMNCARCHNHKFDPILQSDYYRLQAVFAERSVRTSESRARKRRSVTRARRKPRSRRSRWKMRSRTSKSRTRTS